jgi:hypothetical protein
MPATAPHPLPPTTPAAARPPGVTHHPLIGPLPSGQVEPPYQNTSGDYREDPQGRELAAASAARGARGGVP